MVVCGDLNIQPPGQPTAHLTAPLPPSDRAQFEQPPRHWTLHWNPSTYRNFMALEMIDVIILQNNA